MPIRMSFFSRFVAAFAVLALTAFGMPPLAQAAVSQVQERSGEVVTADALPTAQINGVAWDQEVVGNTVYVGGSFSQARPAGAAAGTNQSPRSHLMAYTLSTGVMTSWNPGANAQVRTVTVSPDGSRIYVGGDFTQIAGQSRSRIAAFSTTTGQLLTSFAPPVGYQVNDIVATNTTVYVGGSFAGVGSQPRANLAAFSASSGALLGWAPTANRQVLTVALSEDGSTVLAGGYFETVNGAPARGLAKIDAATGDLLPWPVDISNAGPDAAINNLKVEGDLLFGSGFHFGPGGNQEGPWVLKVSTGELVWVADCHGDTYDIHPSSVVYAVGHAHYCGNVSMGFPQYSTWRFQHNMAWTREATGANIREVHGYANWAGRPSPSMVAWLPTMSIGSFTGQYQAGWTIEGQGDFVVVGGEFPRVNNTAQQGLVRFAKRPVSPGTRGPSFTGGVFTPQLQAVADDAVKVSWTAGFDPDDHEITYQVVRTGAGVVHETTATSTWWDTPGLAWVDRNVNPGQTYTYSLRARDAGGNQVFGSSRSITVPTSFSRTAYGETVLESDPVIYWPLDETGGTEITDHAGGFHGVAGSAVTFGAAGAIPGSPAVSVNNNNNGRIYAGPQSHAPTEMTASVWFRTSGTSGRLLGFGDLQTGNSGRRDRQIYLNNNGRVNFGVQAQGAKVVTSAQTYRDNQWHHAVATLSDNTARLYVDGVMAGQRHDVVEPEEYVGHWRLGGDSQSGWPSAGNANFTGGMDELAIYDRALTPQEVNAQYVASGRASNLPTPPVDAYGIGVVDLEPDLYWRLNETTGSVARDSSVFSNNATYQGDHTKDVPGALADVSDSAVTFGGTNGYVVSDQQFTNPQVFSTEAWFRTTTTSGGKIIGFGNQRTSLSSNYDRHTFMLDDGRLAFGVWTGQEQRATTTQSYNDGAWHHVVSTLSPDGMRIYVDGASVASNPNAAAENFAGYWRAGGDTTWGGSSSNFLAGQLDEVAVYSRALTESEVRQNYVTGSNDVPNVPPTAAFAVEVDHLAVSVDAGASIDEDGSIASYGWQFGDGSTTTGRTAVHSYAASGTYDVTLTVTDDEGATHSVTRAVEVVANQAPVAAFSLQTNHLQVSVDAAASSDTDGLIESYTWDFGDGTTAAGLSASHEYVDAGTYEVSLTVVDDDGSVGTSTESVTVAPAPPNQAPVAAFVGQITHLMVSLDASSSTDTDGSIADYSWDFGDGVSGSGLAATHTYAAPGTYEVTLVVTDDEGAFSSTSQEFTVVAPPANVAPRAAFTVSASDLTVTVDGSDSTDSDGTVESWAWSFGEGASASGKNATHTYPQAGTYQITLVVTDDDGGSATTSQSVTVSAPPINQPPVAAFNATATGLTVVADGERSVDPDGSVASWQWEFGDGATASGEAVTHTYDVAGTYAITLTVTDDAGARDSTSSTVTVTAPPPTNQAPTSVFTSTLTGLSAQFDGAESSDADGSVVAWSWSFGDDSTASGSSTSHTYAAAGTYQVTLTVTDDDGATDVLTQDVTVTAPPETQIFALDTFSRSSTSGWAGADVGGAWSTTNPSALYSVSDGVGRVTMANPGANLTTGLAAITARDVDATVDIAFSKASTGSGIYGTLMVRRDGADNYRVRARVMPTSTMVLLTRVSGGTETVLSNTTLPWVYQPGQTIRLRLVADGAFPTQLRGKAWAAADPEPVNWQVSATDSTPALQDAGSVGLYHYLGGTETGPVVVTVDNLSVGAVGAGLLGVARE